MGAIFFWHFMSMCENWQIGGNKTGEWSKFDYRTLFEKRIIGASVKKYFFIPSIFSSQNYYFLPKMIFTGQKYFLGQKNIYFPQNEFFRQIIFFRQKIFFRPIFLWGYPALVRSDENGPIWDLSELDYRLDNLA